MRKSKSLLERVVAKTRENLPVFSVGLCSLVAGGCPLNFSNPHENKPKEKVVIDESSFVRKEKNTIYLKKEGEIKNISRGTIIASSAGEGFLARVLDSIDVEGGRVQVIIEPITYAEAVENGNIVLKNPKKGRDATISLLSWEDEFNKYILERGFSADIQGRADFNLDLTLEGRIANHKLKEFYIALKGDVSADGYIDLFFNGSGAITKEYVLAEKKWYYPFTVGWAPGLLIIDGKIVLYGGASYHGSGEFEFGGLSDASLEGGVRFENGKWNIEKENMFSFNPRMGIANFELHSSGGVGVKVKFTGSINGVANLNSAVNPYFEYVANGTFDFSNPELNDYDWGVMWGLRVPLSLDVGVFDKRVKLFEINDVFNDKIARLIAQGSDEEPWHGTVYTDLNTQWSGNSGGSGSSGNSNGGNSNGNSGSSSSGSSGGTSGSGSGSSGGSGGTSGSPGGCNNNNSPECATTKSFGLDNRLTITGSLNGISDRADWYKFYVPPEKKDWDIYMIENSVTSGNLRVGNTDIEIRNPGEVAGHVGIGVFTGEIDYGDSGSTLEGTHYLGFYLFDDHDTSGVSGSYRVVLELRRY